MMAGTVVTGQAGGTRRSVTGMSSATTTEGVTRCNPHAASASCGRMRRRPYTARMAAAADTGEEEPAEDEDEAAPAADAGGARSRGARRVRGVHVQGPVRATRRRCFLVGRRAGTQVSRADMWRFKQQVIGRTLHAGRGAAPPRTTNPLRAPP